MSDKNTEYHEQATNELRDIMDDVANQLSNDLYEIPQNATMDKDLQRIDDKLADTAPDINLNDDIINLLESDGEFGLPKEGGLSYEQPDQHAHKGADQDTGNDFAAALAAEAWDLESTLNAKPEPLSKPGDAQARPQLGDDPILLLDDELAIGKKPAGGLMAGLALVFAVLAAGGAGYAVWQGVTTKGQTDAMIERLETRDQETEARPDSQYNQKLTQVEQRLDASLGRLDSLESRIDQQSTRIEDQQAQLGQAMEAIKQQNAAESLQGIQTQLTSLNQSLTGLDERLTQGQKLLEHQQQQLGKGLEQRIEDLGKASGLKETDSSAVVIAEPAPVVAPSQTAAKTEQPKAPTIKPKTVIKTRAKGDRLLHQAKPEKQRTTTAPTGQATDADGQRPHQAGGPWVVNLVSTVSEKEAKALSTKLQRQGIFPKVKPVSIKGTTWYRLHIDGFVNAAAAKRYVDSIKGKPGLGQAWAGKAD